MNNFPPQQGEEFSFTPSQNKSTDSLKKRKPFWFVFGIIITFIVIFFGYVFWDMYWSPEAVNERETQKNYEQAMESIKNYEEEMKNDTYGGKTPQETLDLFIDALKVGDIDLASKYFVATSDTNEEWKIEANKKKEENKLGQIIELLDSMLPDENANINDDYYIFSSRDKNGNVIAEVGLVLNKYSSLWKIEGF